ncbi:50S ribosomal protein L10 [Actinocrinis sp.]|uniref:50S ribosomal protein L10 n=1 Tax=Actinocrinis sp. TaxID=1920516 RepID=UPI0032C212C9
MAKAERQAAVEEITEQFRGSSAALLTEYRGLTVKQLKQLRRSLGADTQYAVVKNTLTKRAAAEAGIAGLDALLAGPSAIAFVKGDAVEAAKGLRDFAKANPLLVIKGGVMDGKALSATDVTKLADLESREVLLAKAAGAMKASLANAAALFQAPLTQFARTADALRAKVEQGGAAVSDNAVSDNAVSDDAVSDAVVSDTAVSDTAVSDAAPSDAAPAE